MTEAIDKAVRAACTAMDVHLRCTFPDCACKGLPIGIKAALSTTLEPSEEECEAAARAMFAATHDEPWEEGEEFTRKIYLVEAPLGLRAAALVRIGP